MTDNPNDLEKENARMNQDIDTANQTIKQLTDRLADIDLRTKGASEVSAT